MYQLTRTLNFSKKSVSFYDETRTVLPSIDDKEEDGEDLYLDRYVTDYYADSEDSEDGFSDDDDDEQDDEDERV